MKRFAENNLTDWMTSDYRKPLVIRGARQVGKSTLVRLFAENEGLTLFEVDLERHPALRGAFASRDLPRILRELEFLIGKGPIKGEKSLLFLDELQAIPEAIPVLRDFYEERPDLAVIAAGSLLEFALADARFSMPVGRIDYLHLEPMTFEEFLEVLGESDLLELLQTYELEEVFPETAHSRLLNRLRDYILVGGMPEAVLRYSETGEIRSAQEAHASILQTYRDDFSKYATKAELRRIQKIYDFAPKGIGEKFKYSRVDAGEQSRDLRRGIDLLAMARVIRLAYHTDGTGIPLGATINEKVFKPYFLDVGLVNAACGIQWIPDEEIRSKRFINEGKLAEQFLAQHLHTLGSPNMPSPMTYWLREGRSNNAELDFLAQIEGEILPLEVKAGKGGSLRSLMEFVKAKEPKLALRFDLNTPNLQTLETSPRHENNSTSVNFELVSLPLYMVGQTIRILANRIASPNIPTDLHS
jgi:uncharacterized protein